MSTLERPPSFGRSSHVRTYWLLHSEGFQVRGKRLIGVVEAVQGQPAEAQTLVVRHGLLGRRVLLPADSVELVVPAEELLIVDRPLPESRPEPAPGRRLVTATDRATRLLAELTVRAAHGIVSVARALRPWATLAGAGIVATARAVGRGSARAARGIAALLRAARPHAARGARAVGQGLAYLWAGVAVGTQAAGIGLARAVGRFARSPVRDEPEDAESLLTRVGKTVGPLEGPKRRP